MELHFVYVLAVGMLCGMQELFCEELYGLAIHWRPTGPNQIVFSYRLIWKKGTIPSCFPPYGVPVCNTLYLNGAFSPTQRLNQWTGYQWKCTSGCTTQTLMSDMSDLYLTDVSHFLGIEWQSAIEMKTFTFDQSDDLANIRISFHDSMGTPVPGVGEARLSMAIRNDTKRANISPVLNVFPVYRVPLECSIDIKLFPFDGDGDYVRCHWEKFPLTADIASQTVLNEDKCEMRVHASSAKGFTAGQLMSISLYAEDYALHPVQFTSLSNDIMTGPFSRTPIKFVVFIGNATSQLSDCDEGPTFTTRGTLPPHYKHSYKLPFNNAKLPFEIPLTDNRILFTGPRLMMFKTKINTTTIEEGTWMSIRDSAMKGIHQACGIAYTKEGVPGDSRCAVLMVSEPDECALNPCTREPGGICDNLFEYNTCTYPSDPRYTGNAASNCKPVIIEEDNTGIRVGLPVGLSLLLLIIIIATAIYLKRYWMEKLKQSSKVKPKGQPNEKGIINNIVDKC